MKNIYQSRSGAIEYRDTKEHLSGKCQPRDIQIITEVPEAEVAQLQWDICADIRLTQGCNEAGLMRGAKV